MDVKMDMGSKKVDVKGDNKAAGDAKAPAKPTSTITAKPGAPAMGSTMAAKPAAIAGK